MTADTASGVVGYLGAPDGPSAPSTPGPYCLARCYCGTCPQYQRQVQAVASLRAAEWAARDLADARDDAEQSTSRRRSGRPRPRRRRTTAGAQR